MATGIKYLTTKVAKWTYDPSATIAIYSGYTFDAAEILPTPDTITIVDHPYKQNDMVGAILTAGTGVTATAPALATAYWVIYVDKDTIALATSLALAKAGTKTALTAGSAVDVYLVPNVFGVIKSGLVIPSGAIVTKAIIDVDTTFVSTDTGTDKAVLGLGLAAVSAGSEDMTVGIAIETGTIWDAGRHGTLVGMGTGADAAQDTAIELAALVATSYLNLTADAELTLNITIASVTAGKMHVYVEYMV